MPHKNPQTVFQHHSNIMIAVYLELFKNKVDDFLYDPNVSINLIQKKN